MESPRPGSQSSIPAITGPSSSGPFPWINPSSFQPSTFNHQDQLSSLVQPYSIQYMLTPAQRKQHQMSRLVVPDGKPHSIQYMLTPTQKAAQKERRRLRWKATNPESLSQAFISAYISRTVILSHPGPPEPPIATLPDSILLEIFELLCAHEYSPKGRYDGFGTSAGSSIIRVCKRWNVICQPLIYRHVRVEMGLWHGSPYHKSRRLLYSALSSKPQLRTYTRRFSIFLGQVPGPDVQTSPSPEEELMCILNWFSPNLRVVDVEGDIEGPVALPILLQLSTMSLQGFRVGGNIGRGGISIGFLLKHFQASRLRALEVSNVSWDEDPDVVGGTQWFVPDVANVDVVEEGTLNAKKHHYSAELKSLTIWAPSTTPAALVLLLKWPRALEELNMTVLDDEQSVHWYTPSGIQELLGFQAHSLRTIDFGRLRCIGSAMLDFSQLLKLESLTLFKENVFRNPPAEVCASLAAPRLRRLAIDCYHCEYGSTDELDVGKEAQSEWLVEFSKAWKSSRKMPHLVEVHIETDRVTREARLQEIDDKLVLAEDEYGDVEWEQDHLPATKKEMATHGVCLTWSDEIKSQEDWSRLLLYHRLQTELPLTEREGFDKQSWEQRQKTAKEKIKDELERESDETRSLHEVLLEKYADVDGPHWLFTNAYVDTSEQRHICRMWDSSCGVRQRGACQGYGYSRW